MGSKGKYTLWIHTTITVRNAEPRKQSLENEIKSAPCKEKHKTAL